MEKYKDLILQGLSARLDTYENTNDKKTIINLTPRHYLRAKPNINSNTNILNNNFNKEENKNINNNQEKFKSVVNIEKSNNFNKFSEPRNFYDSQSIIQKNNNYNDNNNINENININNFINEEKDFPPYYKENNINNSKSNYLGEEIINIDDINHNKKN